MASAWVPVKFGGLPTKSLFRFSQFLKKRHRNGMARGAESGS
jgi:hypothetical protein